MADINWNPTWDNIDPRIITSNCNRRTATIIILRPRLMVGYGDVYEEGWSISTSFEDYKYISANDKWDPDWKWVFAP